MLSDIFSGQKLIKNAKNGLFWRFFRKLEACGQTVLADRSLSIGQKLVENAKIQMRHFSFWHFPPIFKCDLSGNTVSKIG